MIMKNLIFPVFIIALFCCASCIKGKHSKEIKTIDSLISVTDTIKNNLDASDTTKIKEAFKEYNENIGQIRTFFNDKKDSTWSTITAYGNLKNPLKNFILNYPALYNEILYSKKQLNDLKADIRGNKITKEKMAEYTKNEAQAINSLKQHVNISVNNVKRNLYFFDSLNPKVVKVIEQLKKNFRKAG